MLYCFVVYRVSLSSNIPIKRRYTVPPNVGHFSPLQHYLYLSSTPSSRRRRYSYVTKLPVKWTVFDKACHRA